MSIYKYQNHNIVQLKDYKFKSENEIHQIVSNNLETIFGLKLVTNEFSVKSFRFDTLAFDEETKSFVIIEYKNTKSFSVVDQGVSYLSTLLNNKAEFVLEYNDKFRMNYNKNDIDWSATRIIFVSPYFNNYQKESVNFKDLPIELWKIDKYESNLISISRINTDRSEATLNAVSKEDTNVIAEVNKELKVYDESFHIENRPKEIVELFYKLKEYILNIDDNIEVKYTKPYIGFRINKRNFCDMTLQNKKIRMWINIPAGKLDDSKNLFRDVSNIGHWGNGDYDTDIIDDRNLEYIISKVKEAYYIFK